MYKTIKSVHTDQPYNTGHLFNVMKEENKGKKDLLMCEYVCKPFYN